MSEAPFGLLHELLEEEKQESLRQRENRRLALAVVVTSLLVAVVGVMGSYAGRQAQVYGVFGQRARADQQAAAVVARQAALTAVGLVNTGLAYSQQAGDDRQRRQLDGSITECSGCSLNVPADVAILAQEATRYDAEAAVVNNLAPVTPSSPYSFANDANYPEGLEDVADSSAEYYKAIASQADRAASGWSGRDQGLTAVLTLFAVATYLFGVALGIAASIRRPLGYLAVVMVVLGLLYSGYVQLEGPPPGPQPEAATLYAQGVVADETAYLELPSLAGYQQARQDLNQAIRLDPTLGLAYNERSIIDQDLSRAGVLDDNLASDSGTQPIPDLAQAYADAAAAFGYGYRTEDSYSNLGYVSLVYGERIGDSNLVADSIAYDKEAIGFFANDYLARGNLATAEVYLGNFGQARVDYAKAAQEEIETMPQGSDCYRSDDFLSGTLGDLELQSWLHPKARQQIEELETLLVQKLGPAEADECNQGTVPATTSRQTGTFTGFTGGGGTYVDPALLQWQARPFRGFDPTKDFVVQQWFYRISSDSPWMAVSGASGPTASGDIPNGPAAAGVYTPPGTSGLVAFTNNYLSGIGQCLPAGQYEVRLWVDGQPAGESPPFDQTLSNYDPVRLPDTEVQFCAPAAMKEDPHLSRPGVYHVYRAPDGTMVVMARFLTGGAGFTRPGSDASQQASFLNSSIQAALADASQAGLPTASDPSTKTAVDAPTPLNFVNDSLSEQVDYTYTTGSGQAGTLVAMAGMGSGGNTTVGLYYCPPGVEENEGYTFLENEVYSYNNPNQ